MPKWFLHTILPAIMLLSVSTYPATAQVDTVKQADTATVIEGTENPLFSSNEIDTVIMIEEDNHSPRKASLFSAALPGLGQAYNEKFWKIPIIYGGAAILIYFVNDYNDNYTLYLRNLKAERDSDPGTINITGFNDRNLERRVDFYRRNRDYMIILTGFLYLLNIIDAHVDAHLKGFNINREVALRIMPSVEKTPYSASAAGLSLSLILRK